MKNFESSIIAKTMMDAGKVDTVKAICHEIIEIGDGVTRPRVVPGNHCLHLSTAADAADYDKFDSKSALYLFVHEEDIIAAWNEQEAIDALNTIPGNEKPGQ